MNNIESCTDSDSSNKVYNINNNNNSNSIVNNWNSIDIENRNINIINGENNSIVTNNLMNRSTGENRVNISDFLNNECINIYVMWYRLYNFLLSRRNADIIDLNYSKEWYVLFNKQIISWNYSKTLSLVRTTAIFIEIMPRASIRQRLIFRQYKGKLTRSIYAEKII